MTITARYADSQQKQVIMRLEPGDSFGNISCLKGYTDPTTNKVLPDQEAFEFSVGMDIGNKEHDLLFPNAIKSSTGIIQGTPSINIVAWIDPGPSVPASVKTYRAKIILQLTPMPDNSGKTVLEAANEFISSITDSTNKLIATTAFNDAPDIYRNSQTLATIIKALNLSESLVDQMFISAENLTI